MRLISIIIAVILILLLLSFPVPNVIFSQDQFNGVNNYSDNDKSYANYIIHSYAKAKSEYTGASIISLKKIGENPASCSGNKNEYGNYEFYNDKYIYIAEIQYYTVFGIPTTKETIQSFTC